MNVQKVNFRQKINSFCIGQQLLETVIPAKAGIQSSEKWIPAFAGMTIRGNLFLLTSDHYKNQQFCLFINELDGGSIE